jgi:hypothetical protein
MEARLHGAVLAAAAAAAVAFGSLPPKLNPFIQPLMSSIRKEVGSGRICRHYWVIWKHEWAIWEHFGAFECITGRFGSTFEGFFRHNWA